ncbi:hypothetical protein R2F61_02505 [Mollicutes bacterium LVI A0078]|nr:hypothetical protein RZE84_02535 [Mollicutes bacterium LVI A0075]WOO91441.1 hypothetical protein R2F61_02505 [Mollicutes bacterium LVI A0078]
MQEQTHFLNSDITFQGIEAGYFIEVESYFSTLTSRKKPKYNVFMACAHLGLKLNDRERRSIVEVEEYYERKLEEFKNISYNIPRTILMQQEQDIKRLLFVIATVENKDDLDPSELQRVWNDPKISKTGDGYGSSMYRYALNGALYLLLQFKINELNADQINEEVFLILTRDIGEIKLHQNTTVTNSNYVLNEEVLTDVVDFKV